MLKKRKPNTRSDCEQAMKPPGRSTPTSLYEEQMKDGFFKKEAKILLWIALVVPVIGVIAAIVIPYLVQSRESHHPLAAVNAVKADKILIKKKARMLTLFSKGHIIKSYRVALGRTPEGAKEMEGDNKTPEGAYTIDFRNTKSNYHLALHISYPNTQDIQRAKLQGVSPGGNIMIHGIRSGLGWIGKFHRKLDWTKGCIAVTNDEIDEIGRLVANGTSVEIRP